MKNFNNTTNRVIDEFLGHDLTTGLYTEPDADED